MTQMASAYEGMGFRQESSISNSDRRSVGLGVTYSTEPKLEILFDYKRKREYGGALWRLTYSSYPTIQRFLTK